LNSSLSYLRLKVGNGPTGSGNNNVWLAQQKWSIGGESSRCGGMMEGKKSQGLRLLALDRHITWQVDEGDLLGAVVTQLLQVILDLFTELPGGHQNEALCPLVLLIHVRLL